MPGTEERGRSSSRAAYDLPTTAPLSSHPTHTPHFPTPHWGSPIQTAPETLLNTTLLIPMSLEMPGGPETGPKSPTCHQHLLGQIFRVLKGGDEFSLNTVCVGGDLPFPPLN